MPATDRERDAQARSGLIRAVAAVVLVAAVWGGARTVWWLGYANGDDLIYASYAWSFDRLPADHRQFRVLPELAIRAAMTVLGPTELAAALPSLLASAAILASVGWLLGWPRRCDAARTMAMLVAATVPLEVVMASYPGATPVAAGLACLGTVGVLRERRASQVAGATLLGLAVAAHEISVFWVVALALGLLVADRERLRRVAGPLALAVALPILVEAIVYGVIAGHPLLRWSTAAAETARTSTPLEESGGSWLRFVLEPFRMLIVSKQFGLDLVVVGALAALAWRRLERWQRVLVLAAAAYWFWLSFGTQVPWAYRPRTRHFHYFIVFALPVGALLVPLIFRTLRRSRALAASVAVLAVHLACLAAGGRWGQNVEVTRSLLRFVDAHPGMTFLADSATANEMAALHGFVLPANVVCPASDLSYGKLYANLGRPSSAWDRPAAAHVDALVINRERRDRPLDEAFVAFARRVRRGAVLWSRPTTVKPAWRPIAHLIGVREVMVLDAGGEIVALPDRPADEPGVPGS